MDEKERVEVEKNKKKTTDLVEKASGDRKFLKIGSRDFANTILIERKAYTFVEMKKPMNAEGHVDENAEEESYIIKINGAACRTPAEDIKWEEE